MEDLHMEGSIRALGVSNFPRDYIETLLGIARVRPSVVQAKMSVYQPGEWSVARHAHQSFLEWCKARDIKVVAYSVLNAAQGFDLNPMEDPHVVSIARRTGRSAAQVLLRWAVHHDVAVIPRSTKPQRIRENFEFLDFAVAPADIRRLDGLVTLVESTASSFAPTWSPDPFGLSVAPVNDEDMLGDSDMPDLPQTVHDLLYERSSDTAQHVIRVLQQRADVQGFPHSRDVMASHLVGTYYLLRAWGMSEDVCLFGLVHSAYGAGGQFNFTLWALEERAVLRRLVGEIPEHLAYIYGAIDWPTFVARVTSEGGIPSGGMMAHAHLGGRLHLSAEDAATLLIVAMADSNEQRSSGGGWSALQEHPLGKPHRIWGLPWGRPAGGLALAVTYCHVVQRLHAIPVPSIFNDCTGTLDSEAEDRARETYWAAVTSLAAAAAAEDVIPMLQAVAELNPFVGEPLVLLAQLRLALGDYSGARAAARTGLVRLVRTGFAWDASHPWPGWIGTARLAHYRASRLLRGLPPLPRTAAGKVQLRDIWA
eukprot:gnl/TRDRNA2_/TRDRNA2_160211_c0_seq1.p1 gnl/TRDRNA2_/TRDRNA2_160211_c0~~gnl/TRDRNA2_/TRDRNA2_160211_c0_seq1.p1  ORF type:complete len:565 (+),score=72.09 gnl/TRDRNA2_/TRDRNA2_160211_c0_seq1:90-1697(+)